MSVTTGFPFDQELKFRVPADYLDEFESALQAAGFETNRVLEFSAIQDLVPLAVGLGGGGSLVVLAQLVKTVLRRHDGKRFRAAVGHQVIEADGYSEADVETLLRKVVEANHQVNADWQAHLARRDGSDATDVDPEEQS